MPDTEIALMAHLMRRAGFGAARQELEARRTKGYEATVEELLDPDAHEIPSIDESVIYRHNPGFQNPGGVSMVGQGHWIYRMINSPRPLEEKMALFWHHVFATGNSKIDSMNQMQMQIAMFRQYGLGSYRDLLVELARDPAMIFWLDNNQNHKDAPNENWGRELLELFSMGQGNYTEKDVKEASRAFTGWTISAKLPRQPYNRFAWDFEYKPEDHDDEEKSFLGHKGRLNGEDIIDILIRQPATVRFIARHLYNFFVADEVQVPSWQDVIPRDPVAINLIGEALVTSGFDIGYALRVLFNSDFFKDEAVWYAKVKSPVELVVNTLKLTGDHTSPKPGIAIIGIEVTNQGQGLLDPPSVEGWHTGSEWIDSGALLRRINFVADTVGQTSLPGISYIVEQLANRKDMTPEEFVNTCLDLMGPVKVEENTLKELADFVREGGPVRRSDSGRDREAFGERVGQMLQMIASTREYQFG